MVPLFVLARETMVVTCANISCPLYICSLYTMIYLFGSIYVTSAILVGVIPRGHVTTQCQLILQIFFSVQYKRRASAADEQDDHRAGGGVDLAQTQQPVVGRTTGIRGSRRTAAGGAGGVSFISDKLSTRGSCLPSIGCSVGRRGVAVLSLGHVPDDTQRERG
jgi:hypothetical protein